MNKKLVAFLLSTGILVSTCGTVFANEVVLNQPVETVNTPAPPVNTTEAPQVNIEAPQVTEDPTEEEKPEEKQEVKDNWAEQMAQLVKDVNNSMDKLQKITKGIKEMNGMEISNIEDYNNATIKFTDLSMAGHKEAFNLQELLKKANKLNAGYAIDIKPKINNLIDEFLITHSETNSYIHNNVPNLADEIIQNIPNSPLDKEKPEENTPPVKDIINMTNALPKVEEPIEFVNNDSVNVGNDVVENTIGENMKEMVELPKAEELPKVETPKADEGTNKATSTVSESGSKMGSSSGSSTSYSSTGNPKTGDYTTLGASIATMIAGIAGIFVSRKR